MARTEEGPVFDLVLDRLRTLLLLKYRQVLLANNISNRHDTPVDTKGTEEYSQSRHYIPDCFSGDTVC